MVLREQFNYYPIALALLGTSGLHLFLFGSRPRWQLQPNRIGSHGRGRRSEEIPCFSPWAAGVHGHLRSPCRNALDAVWRLPANAEGVVRRACGAAEERRRQATRRSTRQAAGKSRVRRVPTTKAFKVGDPVWIRLPPAAQDNVAQKLLFQFSPGVVIGVSGADPNTYEVRNIA